jgi:tRNA nucleotidyltransferase (CCA-adding enzyme)
MLKTISAERIQEELNKILLSDRPKDGIIYLMNTKLMKYIIPEYYDLVGMKQNKYHQYDAFEHSMKVLEKSPKRLELRLGALLHDIGKVKTKTDIGGKIQFLGHENESAKITDNVLKRLKYSGDIINKVTAIVGGHMKTKQYGKEAELVTDKTLRRLMNDMGDNLESVLQLIHADNISHGDVGWKYNLENQVDAIRDRLKTLGDFTGKLNIPVKGDRIMKLLNIPPGKDVGILLSNFKDIFLDNPDKINSLSDDEIEKMIKKMYKDILNK